MSVAVQSGQRRGRSRTLAAWLVSALAPPCVLLLSPCVWLLPLCVWLLPLCVLLLPLCALAQEPTAAQRETARTWVLEGRRSFAAGDYSAALERYGAAYQLVRAPTVGIELARAQQALGQWVEANATAVEVINLPRSDAEPLVFDQARADALQLLRELSPRIPSLQLDISPSSSATRLVIDGEEMPFARGAMPFKLNPGTHLLQLSAPGYRPEWLSVSLAEQEYRVLPIVLQREPPVAPQPPLAPALALPAGAQADRSSAARTRGYVALSVAGGAALVGTVTGVLAFSSKPDCPGDLCAAHLRDEAERSRAFGNVATVSFGVALAAAAYGGWELLFDADSESASRSRTPTLRAGLAPGKHGAALQLSGAF